MNTIDPVETANSDPRHKADSLLVNILGLLFLAAILMIPRGWLDLFEALAGPTGRLFRWLARGLDYRRYLNGDTW